MSAESEPAESLIVRLKHRPRVSSRSDSVKSLIVCLKYGGGKSTVSRTRMEPIRYEHETDTSTEGSGWTRSATTESVYNDDTDTEITSDSLQAPMYRVAHLPTRRRLRLRFLGSTTPYTARPIRAASPPNPSFISADRVIKTGLNRRYQTAESQREFYTARMALMEKRAQALALFNRITDCLSQDIPGTGKVTVNVSPEHVSSCWDTALLMPDMLQVSSSPVLLSLPNDEGSALTLETPDNLDDILSADPVEQPPWMEDVLRNSQQWTGLATADDRKEEIPDSGLLADAWLGFVEEGSWCGIDET